MRRPDLVPDCGRCAAVCCVATAFDCSEDFAHSKPAGTACEHLRDDHRCSIHEELAVRGYRGCALFDCYGAGQRASRGPAEERNARFLVLREVHELLYFATEAAKLCPQGQVDLRVALEAHIAALDRGEHEDLETRRVELDKLLRKLGEALGGRRTSALPITG